MTSWKAGEEPSRREMGAPRRFRQSALSPPSGAAAPIHVTLGKFPYVAGPWRRGFGRDHDPLPEAAERAMKLVPTTGNAALVMLRQTAPSRTAPSGPSGDRTNPAVPPGRSTDLQARAAVNEALFGVSSVNGETLFVQKTRQIGEVFGLDPSTYKTLAELGAAIKDALIALRANPGDGEMVQGVGARLKLDPQTTALLLKQRTPDLIIRLIENRLGLDQAGVSLTRLVDAAQDPENGGTDAIRTALAEAVDGPARDAGTPVPVGRDEAGLYRVAGRPGS
ncbi:hypothetical protein LRS73_29235 [Methylobacterium currus]|uniref:hypothetical protein n=1 Tax=Methylobacterium currus TaxID=2051553 RepID=UPI001E4A1D9E|nr:hypothetical protein [Methylobacterium currus]UHC19611.1 hypothetical protein LRS73_29235 [Methylobacterium currus]